MPSAWHKNPQQGEQLFPCTDGILAEDREQKLLLHKVEGNFLLPCWKPLLPKISATFGGTHWGEEQVKEENKSDARVCVLPSSITSVAFIATGRAAWDQTEFL